MNEPIIVKRDNVRNLRPLMIIGCIFMAGIFLWLNKQPSVLGEATFVGRESCIACHSEQAKLWQGSHHDKAMAHASGESVLGDFNNVSYTHDQVTTRFFKKGETFWTNSQGPDGKMHDYEIKYTFGYHPLQQYLVEFPGGRLQCLTVAWDVVAKKWYHLYPNEHIPAGDELHWTGLNFNWNHMCAECHSTNISKNYDSKTDTFKTEWSEINVSCEACHGPGGAHLTWANSPSDYPEVKHKGLVVPFNAYDNHALDSHDNVFEVDQCARCHSRRGQIVNHDPRGAEEGYSFTDHFAPATLQESLYYPDGQIQDEVYVYGSFVQSKMYHNNVRCSDCHDPHSLKPILEGNQLCIRCHVDPKFDTPAHHHHTQGSTGAKCVNCHMPETAFMVIDDRRDHKMRIPRPDLSDKIGSPNACVQCHKDKDNQWATTAFHSWTVDKYKTEKQANHFGELFALARSFAPNVEQPLTALINAQETPSIVRATAVELLGRSLTPSVIETLIKQLNNIDPVVKQQAIASLMVLPEEDLINHISPLLTDQSRLVRVEAATALAAVAHSKFSSIQKAAFDNAYKEYMHRLQTNLDRPESHMNYGVLYIRQGKKDLAVESYKRCIAMSPHFLAAYFNLSTLYAQMEQNDKALVILTTLVKIAPDNGDAHYSMGLLLSQLNDSVEAMTHLAKAAELLPMRPRVHYNYALSLEQEGQLREAMQVCVGFLERDDRHIGLLQSLVRLHMKMGTPQIALPYAKRIMQLMPNHPEAGAALQQLRGMIGSQ